MNYLAHLYLADTDADSLVGNLMGDFVKGQVPVTLSPTLRRGIRQHRKIDVFTDSHPIVLRSKRRIGPDYRRYAGVLIDLFYDHALASDWTCYSQQPLEQFVDHVHNVLRHAYLELPSRMQRSVRYMLNNDLLLSYRELDGIGQALSGIQRRLRRPVQLDLAVTELQDNYQELRADFAIFFPDLIGYVDQLKQMDKCSIISNTHFDAANA